MGGAVNQGRAYRPFRACLLRNRFAPGITRTRECVIRDCCQRAGVISAELGHLIPAFVAADGFPLANGTRRAHRQDTTKEPNADEKNTTSIADTIILSFGASHFGYFAGHLIRVSLRCQILFLSLDNSKKCSRWSYAIRALIAGQASVTILLFKRRKRNQR